MSFFRFSADLFEHERAVRYEKVERTFFRKICGQLAAPQTENSFLIYSRFRTKLLF
jgi:hypothetical protein